MSSPRHAVLGHAVLGHAVLGHAVLAFAILACAVLGTTCVPMCRGQVTTYRLSVTGTDITSIAERTDRQLSILAQNKEQSVYLRDPSFDSADGGWLAYRSSAARQIIRWPRDDRGNMMIAAWTGGRRADFRRSRMTIVVTGKFGFPEPGKSLQIRMAPKTAGADQWLTAFDPTLFELRKARNDGDCLWTLLRASGNIYRIQCVVNGRGRELSVVDQGGKPVVTLMPPKNDPGHLWQIMQSPAAPGTYTLRSLAARNSLLGVPTGGGLRLLDVPKTDDAVSWRLAQQSAGRPVTRVISRDVRPARSVADSKVEFRNTHDRDLWVMLVKNGEERRPIRLKIPAGKSTRIELARDSGTTLVETFEFVTRNGYTREQIVTEIPPTSQYDASVYELVVQSVSIDRTVPGGKVDNIGHSPKSVGWFELPVLGDSTVIDVHAEATAMKNPGGVRRLDIRQWQKAPKP